MLELGWGGGLNLVTAELGVMLALPSPVVIAILGQLNVNLPNPDAAVVELHLDVLGIIDFGKKLFSLDAYAARLAHRRLHHLRRHGDAPELGRQPELRAVDRWPESRISSLRAVSRAETADHRAERDRATSA